MGAGAQHPDPALNTELLLPPAAKWYTQVTAQVVILQEFVSANESLLIQHCALSQV